ncbi:hypothetical protein [Aequorivita capsosiphonis]|uniref:hypothetical protein n=1 Tax=Aequorivita capsosiphonis TaxID=487317 RepID=UPI0012F77607
MKYFYRLGFGFYIEPSETEILHCTTNRKRSTVIPVVDADECLRGLRKPYPLLSNDVLKPQKAKG